MAPSKISFGRIVELSDLGADTWDSAAELPEPLRDETKAKALLLSDGETYALSGEDPRHQEWIKFLSAWREHGKPVYVEADDSRLVEMVLAPIARRVEHVSEEPEGGFHQVVIFTSPSIHRLNRAHPRFKQMRQRLEIAAGTGKEVLITTHPNTGEILDVHDPGEEGFEPDEFSDGPVITEVEVNLLFGDLTAHFLSTTSLPEDVADGEFRHLARQGHIPFDYPFDCCTARAHEMCRILRERGFVPRKIWNYGDGWMRSPKRATLRVDTPFGSFDWTYHVAPVVNVRRNSGAVRRMVLDPAILDRPELISTWRDRQQDDLSQWEITEDRFFYRDYFDFDNSEAILDSDFSRTQELLMAHRVSRASQR
jgi:hypothetical protein